MAYQPEVIRTRAPPTPRHHMQTQGSRSNFSGARSARRVSESYHYASTIPHRPARSPHSGPSGPYNHPRLSFSEAVSDLFRLLNTALEFYSQAKRDFDAEVHGITAYASTPLLRELWERRVRYTDYHTPDTPAFKTLPRQLREKFADALRTPPHVPASNNGAPVEGLGKASYARLRAKLEHAYHDIRALAVGAGTRADEVAPLVTELELLVAYLEKNARLWRGEEGVRRTRYEGEEREEFEGGSGGEGDGGFDGEQDGFEGAQEGEGGGAGEMESW